MKSIVTRAASAGVSALVLACAFVVSSCSLSERVAAPAETSKVSPNRRDVPVVCSNMIPNTLATAIDFVASSGIISSFTSRRVRFEVIGDLPSPSLQYMGPCVATDAPTIRIVGGHANMFVHGTRTSITDTGLPLTFGELAIPGILLEKGVVLTQDAGGNVFEVIWPDLAGTGIGQPIVRVQLARWNGSLMTLGQTYDIEFDAVAERDGIRMYFAGHAEGLNLTGTPVLQAGAGSPVPCPQTLAGTSDSVVTQFANIVQFRPGRLRLEIIGDVATGVLGASGACAAVEAGTIQFVGGSANLLRLGTQQSVMSQHQALTFGPLLFPGILLEPGVVVATDNSQDLLEIIWPTLAGLGPGPPILRMQVPTWDSYVATGARIDATMRFDAIGPDGAPASYSVRARDIMVPAMK